MNKKIIRKEILKQRQAMSKKMIEDLSTTIQGRILKASFWPQSGRIGLYASVKNEVMTQTLFQKALEAGLHVYFPRVEQGISFYEVNGPEDLQKGAWEIPEPMEHCIPLLPEEKLGLVIIPGIAFTKDCYRIGQGRGLYDRFVTDQQLCGPTIGLAYDFQVIDSFPLDVWDQSLQGVMTEKNFYSKD